MQCVICKGNHPYWGCMDICKLCNGPHKTELHECRLCKGNHITLKCIIQKKRLEERLEYIKSKYHKVYKTN